MPKNKRRLGSRMRRQMPRKTKQLLTKMQLPLLRPRLKMRLLTSKRLLPRRQSRRLLNKKLRPRPSRKKQLMPKKKKRPRLNLRPLKLSRRLKMRPEMLLRLRERLLPKQPLQRSKLTPLNSRTKPRLLPPILDRLKRKGN